MNEKRFALLLPNAIINDTIVRKSYYLSEKDDVEKLVGVLNEQQNIINKQNNEIKKLKSLLEFSNEQYGQKLLVELRFDNEWKADVSVIDNE